MAGGDFVFMILQEVEFVFRDELNVNKDNVEAYEALRVRSTGVLRDWYG